MDFALEQADRKLKKEAKQRAEQKKRELAKRKAASAKAKRDAAEAEARLAAQRLAREEEDAALGGTAESRARDALARQTLEAAASDGWVTVLDPERLPADRRAIECRAVSAEFLRRLTQRWVTEDMKATATAQAIAYLEARQPRSEEQQRDLDSRRASHFVSGRDVHREIIKAHTHEKMCRYCELAGCGASMDEDGSPSIGDADTFVSWNWDSDWDDLLEALEDHTARAVAKGDRAPRYWLDIFAVNQHTALPPWQCETGLGDECPGCAAMGDDIMSLEEMTVGRIDKGFERVINSVRCKETLVLLEPWFAPRPTTRVWCLYEILLTIQAGKQLTVLVPPKQKPMLAAAIGADLEAVQQAVAVISSADAKATMESDRTKIFSAIQQLLPRGFLDLDNLVKERLREWTVQTALDILAAITNPLDRGTSRLINEVATYFWKISEYDRAEALWEEAVVARRRVHGSKHPSTLNCLGNLGNLRMTKGDLAGAEPLLEEVLAARRRTLGNGHESTLVSIGNLGRLKQHKGDMNGAGALLDEALVASRCTLGDKHPKTLTYINNLGLFRQAKGDLDGAEPLYEEALAGRKRTLGDGHPDTLQSMTNLAALRTSKGDLDAAEALFEEALSIKRRTVGDEHPLTLTSINNLGMLRRMKGDLDGAVALLEEGMVASRRTLGDEHPETLACISNLGNLQAAKGDLDRAKALVEEALVGRRRTLGDEHPHTLDSMQNLEALRKRKGHAPLLWIDSSQLEALRNAKANPNPEPEPEPEAEEGVPSLPGAQQPRPREAVPPLDETRPDENVMLTIAMTVAGDEVGTPSVLEPSVDERAIEPEPEADE